jgi:transposase-like protein
MPNKREINRENLRWLLPQPAEVTLAMLESHLDNCRLLVNEILEEEVTAHCGARYSHEKPHEGRYSPRSVRIGEHRLAIQVPPVFDNQTQSVKPLESYERMRGIVVDDEDLSVIT